MNYLKHFPVNWFDLALFIVLIAGIMRGRKRGMSEELLSVLQWLTIIAVCSLAYQEVGRFMAGATVFSLLFSYLVAYLSIALLIGLLFILIRRTFGGKLLGSDLFGSSEYYLGMIAGAIRFGCILIFCLALLNARLFSAQEIREDQAFQQDVYGSDFFPKLYGTQADVFQHSFFGPLIQENLGFLLIKPTPPEVKRFQQKDVEFPK
jgi:uncharacterized membrane protein required for colicin V production